MALTVGSSALGASVSVGNAIPFGAFGFTVELDGAVGLSCFQEVSGLGISIETEPLKEGGVNSTTHHLIKGASYSNVTLKRGLCDIGMYAWITAALEGKLIRHVVKISMLDDAGKPCMHYMLKGCIPVKWSGPTLSVTSDAIATESIELAHEGLVCTPQPAV